MERSSKTSQNVIAPVLADRCVVVCITSVLHTWEGLSLMYTIIQYLGPITIKSKVIKVCLQN